MASRPTRKHRRDGPRCESYKISYPSYDAALDAAERLMRLGRANPGCHITPYDCDRCGAWHVFNRQIVAMRPVARVS